MKTRHVVALVIGCLLALPGIGSLVGGGTLAAVYAWGRDDSGYYTSTIRTIQTETPAVTIEDVDIEIGPMPRWMADQFAVDLRIRATATEANRPLFVGVGSSTAVNAYLAGTAHDQITALGAGGTPRYVRTSGDAQVAPPTEQNFWTVRDSGTGPRDLNWRLTSGNWSLVLMNADGSPGVSAAVTAGAQVGGLLTIAFMLLGIGLLLTGIAAGLIAYAVSRREPVTAPHAPAGIGPAPAGVALRAPGTPVVLTAQLDPQLSRALWLVKWFLAIPHVIVLAFLWAAFAVTTLIAWFAILFTARYPRALFDFNVGVLRWTWRVSYYCAQGGLGTDRYPAFSLDPVPEDLTTLDVAHPERLSRGLIFVKWILAFPHLLITGALLGGGWQWTAETRSGWETDTRGTGLLGALMVAVALVLLFTGRYPHGLFDLVVGLNRWVYRVAAYVLLMTDEYPPFRLDMGGLEGQPPPPPVPGTAPAAWPQAVAPAPGPGGRPPGAAISELPPPDHSDEPR